MVGDSTHVIDMRVCEGHCRHADCASRASTDIKCELVLWKTDARLQSRDTDGIDLGSCELQHAGIVAPRAGSGSERYVWKMNHALVIAEWTRGSDPGPLFPALLRLARLVPDAQSYLDSHLQDPVDRALCGVGPVPDSETSIQRRVLSALAAADGGVLPSPADACALEKAAEAEGDPAWWVHAARIHMLSDVSREQQARRRLADQNLPYVFPGELHPLMVDLLAAADRVLPALHVDWVRKLTKWMVEDLVRVDCMQRAMWFWPVLDAMDPGRMVRPLAKLANVQGFPPGGLGLAAAYCNRVGAPGELLLEQCCTTDRVILALAQAGMERRLSVTG